MPKARSRLDGLPALHLQHGDFMEQCPNLCRWDAGVSVFNVLPSFRDPWVPSQDEEGYRKPWRCPPTVKPVVGKVEEVRKGSIGEGLRSVYISDRGWEWFAGPKSALLDSIVAMYGRQ